MINPTLVQLCILTLQLKSCLNLRRKKGRRFWVYGRKSKKGTSIIMMKTKRVMWIWQIRKKWRGETILMMSQEFFCVICAKVPEKWSKNVFEWKRAGRSKFKYKTPVKAVWLQQYYDFGPIYTMSTKKVGSLVFGNISASIWPNSKSKVSFENYRFWEFQKCPYFQYLAK